MAFLDVGNGTMIFYRRYGHGGTKVLLIIGLAGTHDSWEPQIKGLTGSMEPKEEILPSAAPDHFGDMEEGRSEANAAATAADDDEAGEDDIEVCCFDNRGVGRSSVPPDRSSYTTTIMAKDGIALLDHLGWRKAHVFGHSMGAMVACKLAALAPERLHSLALLNVTGGGYDCLPKVDRQIMSLALRFLRAKTPEDRAHVDLDTHYTKEYLDENVGPCSRRNILYRKYVKAISSSGMQSNSGFSGHVNACWTHNLTAKELATISSGGFPVSVIHGRQDIIAQLCHAQRLAEQLHPAARMVVLHGAHLVSHERPGEVNSALLELIRAAKSKVAAHEWSQIPGQDSGGAITAVRTAGAIANIDNRTSSVLSNLHDLLGKVQLSFIYIVGLFFMGFQRMKNAAEIINPARVHPVQT